MLAIVLNDSVSGTYTLRGFRRTGFEIPSAAMLSPISGPKVDGVHDGIGTSEEPVQY